MTTNLKGKKKEKVGILVCKQISFNSFKNEIIHKLLTYKSYMNIHLTVCKQMINRK